MSKHILLADDSITIQKVVELTFSADQGYRVTSVSGGNQALAKLREARPDLILCDVIMPEKNGYEVTEALKSNPATRGIPLILLSGTFEPFDEERARRAGADAWITKPFESQALVALVEEHLAKRVTLADSGTDTAGAIVGSSPSAGFGKAPNPDQAINFAPATPNPATTAAMPPLNPRITHPPVAPPAPPPPPVSATAVTGSMAPIAELPPPAPAAVEQRRQAVTQDMISHSEPSPAETLPMPEPTPSLRSTAPWAPLPPAAPVESAAEPEPEFGAGTMQMMIGGGTKPWEKPAELPPPPIAAFAPPEIRPSQLLEETHRKVDDAPPPPTALKTQPFMAEVAPEPPPAYVPQAQRPVSPTDSTETLPTLSTPVESAPTEAPAWLAPEPAPAAAAPAPAWLAPEPAPEPTPAPAPPAAPAWLAAEPAPEPVAAGAPAWLAAVPAPEPEPASAPASAAPAWLSQAAEEPAPAASAASPAWLAAEPAPEPEPPPAFAEPVAEEPPAAEPVAPEPAPAAMPWLSSPPPADLPPTAELASPPEEAFQPPSVRPSQLLEETKRKVEPAAPPPPPEPAPVFATPEPAPAAPEPPVIEATVAEPPVVPRPAPEPELAAAPAGEVSDELVERIARKIVEIYGDKVLREVAWEVIPDLAEMIIRNRINELEAEADKDGKPS